MNKYSKICLIASTIIMIAFFTVQSLIVFEYIESNYWYSLFAYLCIILFMPLFSYFVIHFVFELKNRKQIYDDKMEAINASNIVAVFDVKGKILSVNNNFCELTGYDKSEIVGKHHSSLLPREIAISQEYRHFWKMLRGGIFIQRKFKRLKKNGDVIWIQGSYSPIRNGTGAVYQVIKIASDVSEEHDAMEELQHKNVYLEHSAKILRHDMHSGINTYIPRGIRGLERRLKPEDIKRLKIESSLKLVKEGLAHAQRVYRGVYEFTNLVKKDATMEKTLCKLKDILESYLEKTAYSDQVAIGWLPEVEVNEALFCTAVDNLIRNGIKYNDSEFKMVAVTMVDDNHLGIIDNGRGLTQEEFERLCKPYERKAGQKEQGTGLGLNISVAIFKEHGFHMFVEEQEEGTMIKVKIK